MKSPRVRLWLSSLTARLFSVAAAFAALTGTGSLAMEPANPQVYFDGCVALRRTGSESTCLTRPGSELTLWAESIACEDLSVTESGVAKDPYHQPVYGGCQFRIPVGIHQNISTLEIHSSRNAALWFQLKLDRSQPTFLEHKERMEVRALSDVSEENLLQRIAESTTLEERIDWTWTLAIVYERKGYAEQAISQYRLLAELSSGYPSIGVSANTKIGEILYQAREFGEARQVLEQLKSLRDERDTARELEWTHWSVVLPDVSSQDGAKILDRAIRVAEAVRNIEMQRMLAIWLVQALTDTNQIDKASAVLSEMEIDDTTKCQESRSLANQSWLAMDLIERKPNLPPVLILGNRSIKAMQNTALDAARLGGDCNNSHLLKLYNGMARSALLENRLGDVRMAIELARNAPSLSSNPWVSMSLLDVEAQWNFRTGRIGHALNLFNQLARRAEGSDDPMGVRCRAAVGLLEVAHGLRQVDPSSRAALSTCLPEVKAYNPALYMNLVRRLQRISGEDPRPAP